MDKSNFQKGASNLLFQCAGCKAGDKVLIVGEAGADPFFEPELAQDLAHVATQFGMVAQCLLARPSHSADDFPQDVFKAMEDADITIFCSRLGDQLRFMPSVGQSTKVMIYTLTRAHLASEFGTTDYAVSERIVERLVEVISSASRYHICAADGTNIRSELVINQADTDLVPFSLRLFPTTIFPPIGFRNVNGTLMIDHFTLSSSTRSYDDSVLIIPSPLRATVENGIMTSFEGDPDVITAFKAQCARAASITGGEPFRLNSWHAGVNPYTFFEGNPYDDLERWGTVSYASPRYTHIHAAGKDPGDLAIQIFDASISFDDEWIWKDGRFVFLDRPDIHELLKDAGMGHVSSETRLSIGI